jgi:hypothetical protein
MKVRFHRTEALCRVRAALLLCLPLLVATCAWGSSNVRKLEKLATQCPRKHYACVNFSKSARRIPPAQWSLLNEFTASDMPAPVRAHADSAICFLVGRLSDEGELENVATIAPGDCARAAAAKRIKNQPFLTQIALTDKSPDVRAAAILRLSDQTQILRVLRESPQWSDRKVAFGKLDPTSLATLLDSAKDPAVQLASEVRLGRGDWGNVFKEAQQSGKLGDALGAVALVDRQAGLTAAVTSAAHHYITQGDSSRIPELQELLRLYGDIPLAEDYINCGQSDLYAAGAAWATAHGYTVLMGNGSNRVRWGSARQ